MSAWTDNDDIALATESAMVELWPLVEGFADAIKREGEEAAVTRYASMIRQQAMNTEGLVGGLTVALLVLARQKLKERNSR